MWKKLFRIIFSILFFPFYFITRTARSKKRLILKIFIITAQVLFLIPTWLIIVAIIYFQVFSGLFPTNPFRITGNSMLPTLKNEELMFSKPYPGSFFFKGEIKRGDIVTFSNEQIEKVKKEKGASYVKRVIALAGDVFEIREGFIFINGKLVDEPYIANGRSTYGGEKISECQKIKVPEGKLLVLGDNRKLSSDSRELGLIPLSDIQTYLHMEDQEKYKIRWRDSSEDKNLINKSSFITDKYIVFLNKEREKRNLIPLKLNQTLSKSAKLRAETMLKFNDLSWSATISGYPMWRSMADAGYSNISYGEYPLLGYYNADELIAFEKEHQDILEFFMNKDYQDIGISTFIGEMNGCPTEIILQQVAGYVPPNYDQSTIQSWEKSLSNLREIQPGWLNLKNNNYMYGKYKSDIDNINNLISIRIANLENIVSRMKNNQWASGEMKEDKELFNQIDGLANKLNSAK